MTESHFYAVVRSMWPNVEGIDGDGHYAIVSHCGRPTVNLFPTIELAAQRLVHLSSNNCRPGCMRKHMLVDLSH